MSASLGLFRLQQVDRQIDRARTRLDVIQKTIENDSEMRLARAQHDGANNENQHAQHGAKNAEAEVDSLRIKIEQTEASLYSGAVKNPKELQDLQRDVASLKKHLIVLEERQLEAMLLAETTSAEFDKAQSNLVLVQSRLGVENKKLVEDESGKHIEIFKVSLPRERKPSKWVTEIYIPVKKKVYRPKIAKPETIEEVGTPNESTTTNPIQ